MNRLRLSKRARMAEKNGRDPAEVIYDLVYFQGKTLAGAATEVGVSESTAQRWLKWWMDNQEIQTAEVA